MTNIGAEQFDAKDLKIMALRERVATLTAEYEDKIADLRVELTLVSQRLEEITQGQASDAEGPTQGEVPEGWPREAPEDR